MKPSTLASLSLGWSPEIIPSCPSRVSDVFLSRPVLPEARWDCCSQLDKASCLVPITDLGSVLVSGGGCDETLGEGRLSCLLCSTFKGPGHFSKGANKHHELFTGKMRLGFVSVGPL